MVIVNLSKEFLTVDIWRADSFTYEEDAGLEGVDLGESDIIFPRIQIGKRRKRGTPMMLEPGTEEVSEIPEDVAMQFIKEALLIQPMLPPECEVVEYTPGGDAIISYNPTVFESFEFKMSADEVH